eukprot:746332-Hanusia_phi.AAC.24
MLSGHIQESFRLNVDTEMVRRGYSLCVRVMDWKPLPGAHLEIGSSKMLLEGLTRLPLCTSSAPLELKSNGELLNTYGRRFKKDEIIQGHVKPDEPALVLLTVVLTTPPFQTSDILQEEDQLQAWDFFLLSPEEQVLYSKELVRKEKEFVEKEAKRKKMEKKMARKVEEERNADLLLGMIRDPSNHRMNWKQLTCEFACNITDFPDILQAVVKDELLRREWGATMDKFDGAGGWKRSDGNLSLEALACVSSTSSAEGFGTQERMLEAERLLVQKLDGYKQREQDETESVKHFVQVYNSKHLLQITNHLRERTDPGGKFCIEKYPGSKALGGSISRVLPTADISRRKMPHLSWTAGRPSTNKSKQTTEAAILMALEGFSQFVHALAVAVSKSSQQLSVEEIAEKLVCNSRRWKLIEIFQGFWLHEKERRQLARIKSKTMV